jgi:hypothetical protein
VAVVVNVECEQCLREVENKQFSLGHNDNLESIFSVTIAVGDTHGVL